MGEPIQTGRGLNITRARAGMVAARALQYLVAVFVLWIHLVDPDVTGFFAARFDEMIYGTAFKPYVYRALICWLVRYTVAIWPPALKQSATWAATHHRWLSALLSSAHFDPSSFPEALTVVVYMYISLLLFAGAVRNLVNTLYDASPLVAEVVAVVALVGLQTMFNYQNYIYDFPTIALFAVGLQLLAQQRFYLFFVVYSIGLFSKETVVLLGLAFALDQWRVMEIKKFAGTLAALGAVFVASRLVLNALYSRNLGDYLLDQLTNHNVALLHSYPPSSLATAGLFAIVVFGHWYEKPLFARKALWLVVPLLSSCLFFGFLDELRDYYEVYPIVLVLGAMTVGRLMGVSITTRSRAVSMRSISEWLGTLHSPQGASS